MTPVAPVRNMRMGEGRFFDVGKHVYFEYQGLRGYAPFEEWLAPKG